MAKQIGINSNVRQVVISGARVAFDPRTTGEAHDTRDMTNRKALEQPMRKSLWQHSQNEANRSAA